MDASSGASRFDELDSLRAAAALGVIGWHYSHAFGATPFAHLLAPFYGRGLLMVDFFFVLSGFVISRSFWTPSRSAGFAGNVRARIARMYPLHFIMLCVVALLQFVLTRGLREPPFVYSQNDAYHFFLNATLLNSSGLQRGFSFNAPSWSISTEFLVNLLFLAAITAPRKIARFYLFSLGLAALATVATRGVINGTPAWGWLDNDLIRTCAGFMTGVLLERIHAHAPPLRQHTAWDVVLLATGAAILAYLAAGRWSNIGDMMTCYLGFPIVIAATLRSHLSRNILRMRPLVYLGTISYSIYLVHFPLQLLLHLAVQAGMAQPDFSSRWTFLTFIAAVLAVASVTYHWIELPGKRWLGKRTITTNV
jgi:peptidoglycan/LPS O-acetylase OafA/YrhL